MPKTQVPRSCLENFPQFFRIRLRAKPERIESHTYDFFSNGRTYVDSIMCSTDFPLLMNYSVFYPYELE
ncbi:MAG: hypothetical protein C5B49_15990 [Bdellovibrio sp.]|nr:MAG: hypothetical protein C5B49_15990 [Bdellovibrio sp.]